MTRSVEGRLRKNLSKFYGAVFSALGLRAGAALLNLLCTWLIVDRSAPEFISTFFFQLALLYLISATARMGLDITAPRSRLAEKISFVGSSFLLLVVAAMSILLSSAVLVVLNTCGYEDLLISGNLFLGSAAMLSIQITIGVLFISVGRWALAILCQAILFPLFIIVFIFAFGVSDEPMALIFFASFWGALLSMTLLFTRIVPGDMSPHVVAKLSRIQVLKFFRDSFSSLPIILSGVALNWTPLLLAPGFLATPDAAHFSILHRYLMSLSMIKQAVNSMVLSRWRTLIVEKNYVTLSYEFSAILKIMIAIALAVCLCSLIFLEFGLLSVINLEGLSLNAFFTMILAHVILLISGPAGAIITMSDRPTILFRNHLSGIVISICTLQFYNQLTIVSFCVVCLLLNYSFASLLNARTAKALMEKTKALE